MLNKLIESALKAPGLVIVALLVVISLGVAKYRDMPVDAFPDISPVMVPVFAEGHGMAPEEVERLKARWKDHEDEASPADDLEAILGPERVKEIDPFDRVQLAEVIRVCKRSGSLSEAGRYLFSVSRLGKKQPNDADRLKKYLERFGLPPAAHLFEKSPTCVGKH